MKRIIFGAVLASLAVSAAGATSKWAPQTSIRPEPRAPETHFDPKPVLKARFDAKIRPRPRSPGTEFAIRNALVPEPEPEYALASTRPVFRSPRPEGRPRGLRVWSDPTPRKKAASMAVVQPSVISSGGIICGDPALKGERLSPVQGKLPGCRIDQPVRVSSVDGIRLTQKAVLDCRTATTLRKWVSRTLKPVIGRKGGGVESLSVPSHYACRTRSSQKGAKLSQHAKGLAIDISSINLRNGTKLTVLDGWKNRRDRKTLIALHSGACGPFGTVLGPDSDRFHQDHFHFDISEYRGGAYCR